MSPFVAMKQVSWHQMEGQALTISTCVSFNITPICFALLRCRLRVRLGQVPQVVALLQWPLLL